MARTSQVSLHAINVVNTILGLAIAATSIWFFVQVQEFTSLRNSNHYLLDYNVYWPQAVPWMFLTAAIYLVCVCGCGFASASKKSKGLLKVYIVCLGVAVLGLIAASVVSLIFADSQSTDDFVKDTVWDGFSESKNNMNVESAFSNIERKFHCCGAYGPRDYTGTEKREFPMSCCDTYYHGWAQPNPVYDCAFSNKLPNERHGCSTVAAQYARIAIKVLSGGAIFVAFIAIIGLVAAVSLYRALNKRPRVVAAQNESESKKVLL